MRECQLCKNCYTDDLSTCPKDGMPTMHTISGEPVLEGKYHLECRLGQGGMGVVYKARHAYLKTLHAIKVILPDLVGNDPQLVTRFRQEALAAAAIRHQNVVSVSDYGVAQGVMPFLVMEYVEGESLHDLLAREKQLSPEKAFELMSAIAAGVGAAHQQGIVHRDLKPLNVMIVKGKANLSEAVKILDFGLAKIKSGELLGSFIQAQTTGLMGSPYYMAPEQWSDEEPDARSDVYSLGVMLYQMIAGDVPFKGASIPAIMKKHLTDSAPPLSNFGVQPPTEVEDAIRHSLEKEPEKRTQTVELMIEELRYAIGISSQGFASVSQYTGSSLPVSSLRILTSPAQSKVLIDNNAVGESRADGWLLLEGLQSGNHHLRVKHEGFQDWEQNLTCDGTPLQVIAELRQDTGAIPKPMATMPIVNLPSDLTSQSASQGFSQRTHHSQPQTIPPAQQQVQQPVQQNAAAAPEKKKSFFSPLIIAVIGISGLFLLTAIGVVGAYMLGIIGGKQALTGKTPTPTVAASPVDTPLPIVKTEMIEIPGGNFTMGRNDGDPFEKPEHEVEVKSFKMDKTEVTNIEFYTFVRESGYDFESVDWVDKKLPQAKELTPIRSVNIKDVNAFIEWRSKRDGVAYRLPNEEEWEYAARNGVKATFYPWGNEFKEECAVLGNSSVKVEPVGSKPCGENDWKVQDLVGNVWEWTSSEPKPYPGMKGKMNLQPGEVYNIARGGSAYRSSKGQVADTSTYRYVVPSKVRDNQIGFRLVSD
ncbi:MAG: bifunctional serine/threonine-protein kinase/formylglycine-generating enzyme family protein [Pyrinomonadaceae bacterium]